MIKYWNIFLGGYKGYWNYLINEVLSPSWTNYFYWLIGLSIFVYILELSFPWRKNQKKFRKDFWLDVFYMFFNFFLFSLIIYNAASDVVVNLFNDFLKTVFGIKNIVAIHVQKLPVVIQLGILFVFRDFIHWNVHRLLHRVPFLWQFHKVHHSVKEMGFAAHLRYHWMENIVYRSLEYIPIAMIGFGIKEFFIVHMVALTIGHLNHANLKFPLGPLKYIFNNPQMHIWHHAKKLPRGSYGKNFGISLSIWDYIFKTNYIPKDGMNIELGFDKDEHFPDSFLKQSGYPWYNSK